MRVKNFLAFILFSSIFIASCAVAFAIETNILLDLPFNSPQFYSFIFGATLLEYNLHYVLKNKAIEGSARFAWSMQNKRTHYFFLLIGLLLVIISLFSFKLQHLYVLLFLGAVSVFYSFPFLPFGKKRRLKEYGLLKITILSLLWTLVTVWFPVSGMTYDVSLFWLIFSKRFLFMFVLCLLFDMRDIEVDSASGIKTFPVRFGIQKSYYLSYTILLIFILLSALQYYLWGNGGFFIAMILSSLATFLVINLTKKNQSDFIFLAGIDGMMLLQAFLVCLFSLK